MEWKIKVSKRAAEEFRQLDASLRAELIEHAAKLAESPAEQLTRSTRRTGSAVYSYTYRSTVVLGLVVTLHMDGFDESPPRLDLVAIGQVIEGAK